MGKDSKATLRLSRAGHGTHVQCVSPCGEESGTGAKFHWDISEHFSIPEKMILSWTKIIILHKVDNCLSFLMTVFSLFVRDNEENQEWANSYDKGNKELAFLLTIADKGSQNYLPEETQFAKLHTLVTKKKCSLGEIENLKKKKERAVLSILLCLPSPLRLSGEARITFLVLG